jgi:multiple sugar transport system ATP-binding protein
MNALPQNRRDLASLGNPPINIFGLPFTGDGFQLGDRMIPATIALRRVLKGELQSGQRFDFGIRPEHVTISSALPHVMGTVISMEARDSKVLVRAELPGPGGVFPIVFWLSNEEPAPAIGDVVPLKFDLKQMALFDLGTGDRIFPLESE